MAISLTIDGAQVALKKGSSIEYVSENRIFTDADDYSLEIELPLAECPQNIAVFGHLTRKDIDTDKIFFNAVLQDLADLLSANFRKRTAKDFALRSSSSLASTRSGLSSRSM